MGRLPGGTASTPSTLRLARFVDPPPCVAWPRGAALPLAPDAARDPALPVLECVEPPPDRDPPPPLACPLPPLPDPCDPPPLAWPPPPAWPPPACDPPPECDPPPPPLLCANAGLANSQTRMRRPGNARGRACAMRWLMDLIVM